MLRKHYSSKLLEFFHGNNQKNAAITTEGQKVPKRWRTDGTKLSMTMTGNKYMPIVENYKYKYVV